MPPSRRAAAAADAVARARERAYAFMSAAGGNLPGFEEATRALFAGDPDKLASQVARWPRDLREHLLKLAQPDAPVDAAAPAG